ncbi:MAG: radical SAM protein [Alphaproteobacteria bacterium]|nr:radical SAM protein [Alphaproteobacteria bacterium]
MTVAEPRSDGLRRSARRRARFWRNIATSAAMRRVRPEWVPLPHAGHLILTFRCNLKCNSCGSWQVPDHDDLTTEEWLATMRQLTSLDVVKVLGGEPFARRDIVELLVGVREIIDPYVMQLTTNGMLTKRTIAAVEQVAWPGLQLRISIDGIGETHDRSRGVPGSFQKVLATARAVAELKAKHGFHFGINFALTDDSLDDMEPMLRLAEELGADLIPGVSVDPFLVDTQPPEIQRPKVVFLDDKERALQVMKDSRSGAHGQLNGIDNLWFRHVTLRTFERQLHGDIQQFTCRELRDLLYLLPNGDVVRCGMDHRPIGNVRRQPFREIWYGERADQGRCEVDDCVGCLQASVQIMSRGYAGSLR